RLQDDNEHVAIEALDPQAPRRDQHGASDGLAVWRRRDRHGDRPEHGPGRRAEPLRQRGHGDAEFLREARRRTAPPQSRPRQRDRGPTKRDGISDLAPHLAVGESLHFSAQTPDLFVHRCTSLSWWCNDALPGGQLPDGETRGVTNNPLRYVDSIASALLKAVAPFETAARSTWPAL